MYNLFPTSCVPIDQTRLKVFANTTSRKRKRTSTASGKPHPPTSAGEPRPPTQFQYQLLSNGDSSEFVRATKRPKADKHVERHKQQGPGYQNSKQCCTQHEKGQASTCTTKLQGLAHGNATEYAHPPMTRRKMRLQRSPISRRLTSPLSGLSSRGRRDKLSRWLLSLSPVRQRRVCRQLARSGISEGIKRSVLQRVCPRQKHHHKRRRKRKIISGELCPVVW